MSATTAGGGSPDDIDIIAASFVAIGMPRVPARIMTALVLSNEEALTAADLSKTLMLSPAAVSGGIAYLTAADIVRSGVERGTRRRMHRLVSDPPWYATVYSRACLYERVSGSLRDAAVRAGSEAARERATLGADFYRFAATDESAVFTRWLRTITNATLDVPGK